MNSLRSKIYPFILLTVIIFSCNAPRNNPLDPENPDNDIATIEGYIKTVKVPQNPVNNVKIVWLNDGRITYSNDDGFFRIDNIRKIDGGLTIEKDGFPLDTITVIFNDQTKISKNIFLNAAPKLNILHFFSITENKFLSNQKYSLGVRANITDEENDIDSVFIENSELETRKELIYNISNKQYENTIFLEDLNITSIDIVIGKEFTISVYQSASKKIEIGLSNIRRIIKEEINPTAPLGRDTVYSANPTLEWNRFTPGFEFKYLLQIYTDDLDRELIWEKEISSEEIQYLTDANLVSGEYLWTIWAIDEFENRTRSRFSSFIIKN